jgi:hypothetical protein
MLNNIILKYINVKNDNTVDINTTVCHRQIGMIFLEIACIYWNWIITV